MPQVEYSITINRPISEVFRFASNFNNAEQWQPDIIEAHQSDDKLRVGIMITQRRRTRLLGWRLDLNADILGYAPNKLIEYKGILGRFPIHGKIEFVGTGGNTQINYWMNIRMGFLYGLFSPMMKGVMTRRTKISLESLKKLLEEKSATTSDNVTDFHKGL